MAYLTVTRFYTTYPKFSTVGSATIEAFLRKASAIIDAYACRAMTVPVTPAPPLFESLCEDLAYVMYLRRNTVELSRDSEAAKVYGDCIGMLEDIAAGKMTVVSSGGDVLTTGDRPWSSISTGLPYLPTFGVFDIEDAAVDSNRLYDELVARGFAVATP